MGLYRKKPVVIEAFQVLEPMVNGDAYLYPYLPVTKDIIYNPMEKVVEIRTLEGTMLAQIGDWIIKGIKGEYYPCKPDIFEATYEKV